MNQNAAAQLVFSEPKRVHVTPLFVFLHWLPVAARIKFKTLMLAYRTATGSAPTYFHSLMTIYIPSRSLRSVSEWSLVVPSQIGTKSLSRTFSPFNKQIQIKLGWALFVTYTIIQSIMRSEMCSLHLTHPSVHTWSSGQPTVQRPGSSHGLPVGAGIRTHNLGLPRVSSPTFYPLGQRLPGIRNAGSLTIFKRHLKTHLFHFHLTSASSS